MKTKVVLSIIIALAVSLSAENTHSLYLNYDGQRSITIKAGGCYIKSNVKPLAVSTDGGTITGYKSLFQNGKNVITFEEVYLDSDYDYIATTEYLLSKAMNLNITNDTHTRYYAMYEGLIDGIKESRVLVTQPLNSSFKMVYGFDKKQFDRVKECIKTSGDDTQNKMTIDISDNSNAPVVTKPLSYIDTSWFSLNHSTDVFEKVSSEK